MIGWWDPRLSRALRTTAVLTNYLTPTSASRLKQSIRRPPGHGHRLRGQFGTHVTARISLNSRGSFAQVSPAFSLANSSP
jgi:hypothetical protein